MKNCFAIFIVLLVSLNLFGEESKFDFHHSESIEIILAHGTFGTNSDWYQEPKEISLPNFYSVLQAQACKSYASVKMTPFQWSGHLGYLAKIEAATALTKHILNSTTNLITVGHSHGGTVVNISSIMLEILLNHPSIEVRLEKINHLAEMLFHKSKEEEKQKDLNRPKIISAIKSSLLLSEAQKQLPPCSLEEFKKITLTKFNEVEELLITKNALRYQKPFIKYNFLLGTPADLDFAPSKAIVERSFSLYSEGDMVQTVFGLYGRTFDLPFEQLINLRVSFQDDDNNGQENCYYPTHSSLHEPRVAYSLLNIPKLCQNLSKPEYQKARHSFINFYQNNSAKIEEKTIHASWSGALFANLQDLLELFI